MNKEVFRLVGEDTGKQYARCTVGREGIGMDQAHLINAVFDVVNIQIESLPEKEPLRVEIQGLDETTGEPMWKS